MREEVMLYLGASVGKNGLISLATLNGANGFKLDGESLVITVASAWFTGRYQWRW